MTHYDIFNYKGVSESREVARGPKDPPPGVIGLNNGYGTFYVSDNKVLASFSKFPII